MKKIFFSLLALAALAACSKSEVEYTDNVEIGFAPVAKNITKSVAGLGTGVDHDASFPTDLNLFIFANAQADDLSSAWPAEYLSNAKFVSGRLSNGLYEGAEAYYWPNVKSLVFAGYSSPSADALNASMTFADNNGTLVNQLVVNGYTQDNTSGYTTASNGTVTVKPGVNELMWFPWDGNSHTKTPGTVPVTMKHACSWITVKVLRDANTTNQTWKLKNLNINSLYHLGNATCGSDAATWELNGTQTPETLFASKVSGGSDLSTSAQVYEDVANNMVVIPQTPTSIDVTYSYVPQTGVAPITETKTNLNLKVSDDSSTNKWESGKHYVYTITITATEILVNPSVSEWTETIVTPGTTI